MAAHCLPPENNELPLYSCGIPEWFRNYAGNFLSGNGAADILLCNRYDHSLRVARLCAGLSEELGWTGKRRILGEMLGLLHDIGRFSQIAEFGTLIDAVSINHGERGYEVTVGESILDTFPEREKQILLNGIRYHNRRKFRDKVPGSAVPFVNLLRDAEKLDRYATYYGLRIPDAEDNVSRHATVPVNPVILDEISQGKSVSRKHARSEADLHLIALSWVYDIHYRPAMVRIHESAVIDTISQLLPKTQEIPAIIEMTRKYVRKKSVSGSKTLR